MKTLHKALSIAIALTITAAWSVAKPAKQPTTRVEVDIQELGGLIKRPAKGYVAICNCQSSVSPKDISALFLMSSKSPIQLNFRVSNAGDKFVLASAKRIMGDANAAIFIVDEPNLPMSLVAMEAKWGLVNVAQLKQDSPKTLTLIRRLDKLVSRVATNLLGGNMSLQVKFSAMQPVFSLEELDCLEGNAFSPMALTQMMFTIGKMGLSMSEDTTYEQACMEGWAPPPTNEIQKAIWDEIRSLPQKPIKIEFDPVRGK